MHTPPKAKQTSILELPYHSDSLGYLDAVAQHPYPVLLSSANSQSGRYDILSASPATLIESNTDIDAHIAAIADAINRLTTAGEREQALQDIPFISGAIGLLSYAAGAQQMGIASPVDNRWPALHAGIYQWALVQDHHKCRTYLLADVKLADADWRALCELFLAAGNKPSKPACQSFSLNSDWQSSLPRSEYKKRFEQLQRYILAGDCYQANLTREFSARFSGDPLPLYAELQAAAAAPFSAFLRRPEADLISASPERFIRVQDGVATTQPIKGSRPRGASASEDAERIAALVASEKDRAENLMIVDLLRNDFGKCCVTGSVSVPELFRVQSFSNVHHLVSTVRGELAERSATAALTLLASCMPGGSITGAPKQRAMQIIAELEPHARSVYCGALFYLDCNGRLDSNILIRSLLFSKTADANAQNSAPRLPTNEEKAQGTVFCWSGGGIVADSDCDAEFAESDYKVAHLLKVLSDAKG